ncbi:DNA translocase FtsK [Desulfosoma caldarium]|uniref:DNA translocase FtsK n=1 Tax=Desulfosoma caldarium TaxID=610254 RepID=A0A3N1UN69_9BACT|nr:DNA translocase FtsK [Desulfosoma caldarium]ROQ91178.1 DNA translocase FtsK [Desulfosoma caldarium]
MERKKHEAWALAVLTVSILIAASLVSYHHTDPTFFASSSSGRATLNHVGVLGAHISWLLFFLIGIGAYAVPLIGVWWSWRLLRGLSVFPYGRMHVVGLVLMLWATITLAAFSGPTVSIFGQEVLAGGQLGSLSASFLASRLNTLGAHVLLGGLLLIGLILATPFTLGSFGKMLLSIPRRFISAFKKTWSTRSAARPVRELQAPSPKLVRERSARRPKSTFGADRKSKDTAEAVTPLRPADQGATISAPNKASLPAPRSAKAAALPPVDLLDFYAEEEASPDPQILQHKALTLEEKLKDFGVQGKVVGINPGPVITMYEYSPAPGIKISRIVGLADDLSMALKASSVRVVAPIPGKAAIGIEIPNEKRAMVSLRSIIESKAFAASTSPLTIALGKDITGNPVITQLTRMPHLLIAGATGTGKSVCINAILLSLLYRNTPDALRFLLIDPKRIELSTYEGIPHLLHPVVTEPKMATRALRWAVHEMEMRYKLLADKNVRNIESYNRVLAKDRALKSASTPPRETANGTVLEHHPLPYIVLIIDELADLMMVASREVEESITRLAQMARAAGIHLILATQRPSVDVLTGIIKANIPTRISFQVSSKVDSRTVLDTNGAETLLGAGDMLFLPPGTGKLQRIQGAFVSDDEVQRITDFWRERQPETDPIAGRVSFADKENVTETTEETLDEKYEEAVRLVVETRQASISMIQRRLRIGYNRAARMIEIMEQQGIVSPSDGSRPREVLVSKDSLDT